MLKIVKVKSWADLNDELFSNTWDRKIKRHRSTFAYRGINVHNYPLSTGLKRLGKFYPKLEENLIKQFKKYAHDNVVERDTEWHWVSIAQHHGLPTRLLDWTYSPFVALHFATNSVGDMKKAGAVWKVNFSQAHDLLQTNHRKILDKYGSRIFSIDALAKSIKNLKELSDLSAPSFDVAVFFEPPAIDERITNQFAYFSALSNPRLDMNDWFNMPHVKGKVDVTKIVIPGNLKWEIRDKLDQSNINERVLLRGLDGLCTWLKRHYTPV